MEVSRSVKKDSRTEVKCCINRIKKGKKVERNVYKILGSDGRVTQMMSLSALGGGVWRKLASGCMCNTTLVADSIMTSSPTGGCPDDLILLTRMPLLELEHPKLIISITITAIQNDHISIAVSYWSNPSKELITKLGSKQSIQST